MPGYIFAVLVFLGLLALTNPAAASDCIIGAACNDVKGVRREHGGVTYCCPGGSINLNVNTNNNDEQIDCDCNGGNGMQAVNGNWGLWDSWTGCSKTCGTGAEQTRSRTCTNPEPAHGGQQCDGSKSESRTCDTKLCPINGNWASWDSWTGCSKTCGTGTKTRNRTCTNPAPAHGGQQCDESMSESKTCNTKPCPTPTTEQPNNSSQQFAATWISVFVSSLICLVF